MYPNNIYIKNYEVKHTGVLMSAHGSTMEE